MQFSIVAVPIYNLTNSAQRFPFLHTVTNTCYLAFLTIAILICVIILHCLTESSGNAECYKNTDAQAHLQSLWLIGLEFDGFLKLSKCC